MFANLLIGSRCAEPSDHPHQQRFGRPSTSHYPTQCPSCEHLVEIEARSLNMSPNPSLASLSRERMPQKAHEQVPNSQIQHRTAQWWSTRQCHASSVSFSAWHNLLYDALCSLAANIGQRKSQPCHHPKQRSKSSWRVHSSLQAVFITLAVCLTASSCQPRHSLVDSPPNGRLHLSESPNKTITTSDSGGDDDDDGASYRYHRVHNQIIYMPAHINQPTDLPPCRYQHANRCKQRSKRSSKSRQTTDSQSKRRKPNTLPSWSKSSLSAPKHRKVPLLKSFSSQSSVLSSVSMLSSSTLTAQMKPPYVNGPTDLSGPQQQHQQVSANKVEYPAGTSPKNITAQVGHPVYMHCIIEALGDKMVSWIRLRDFHLLTIGSLTYIQEDRFAVRYNGPHTNDWSLQIKHVTVKDEGLYECQINSDPPRSQYYYLHVVVPVSEIVGNPDIFVRSGAPINLTCLISSSPEPPAFVFWYHNERMINYDYNTEAKGQISVQKSPTKSDVTISRLLIKKAKLEDSGNYTCSPSNAEPASTYVHVLQGEKRLSNQIQNDWSQTEPSVTNEGHHSGQCRTASIHPPVQMICTGLVLLIIHLGAFA